MAGFEGNAAYWDRCDKVLADLRQSEFAKDLMLEHKVPLPHVATGPIRLFIIGQDPTIDNPAKRARVTTTLLLDQPGHLRDYVERLCDALGVDFQRSVYATNLCKNFFVEPPGTRFDLIRNAARFWVPMLLEELACFPNAAVLTLGEGVLRALVNPKCPCRMRHYWGHKPLWKQGNSAPFSFVSDANSSLGRAFFPMVHQPTYARNAFYRARFEDYIRFIRQNSSSALTSNAGLAGLSV